MSPILGIYASQISGHLSTNNYASISTINITNNTTNSITFSSIPSTYTHLQVRMFASTYGSNQDYQKLTFNGDTTGSDYYGHNLGGDGTSAYASAWAGSSYSSILFASGGIGDNGYFSGGIMDILDYTNTNKYKTMRMLEGFDQNGSGQVYLNSGLWQSTSAITSITITGHNYNYASGSSFALYGIK